MTNEKRLLIVLGSYGVTAVAVVLYTIYMAFTIPDNQSIALLFAPFFLLGGALFLVSLFFAVIFYKHKPVWGATLPVLLLTSVVPGYFIYSWIDGLPAKVPVPGPLPVTKEQYLADGKLILDDYWRNSVDSNRLDYHQLYIQQAFIDTIIYSSNKQYFFAVIIIVTRNGDKVEYCSAYRAGNRIETGWELTEPSGNTALLCAETISQFKTNVRQYYYKRYSINGSSGKDEIWKDRYIFYFE